MEFNKDDKRRHEILKLDYPSEMLDGIEYFEKASVTQIKRLIKEGFLDIEEKINESPSTREFIKFLEKHPNGYAHGYLISVDREDYRVSIEGIGYKKIRGNIDLRTDFINFCMQADVLIINETELYAWWD